MSRHILVTAALISLVASQLRAQVYLNQPQGPNILQQLQDNMNNAGMTPQDLFQQARDQWQQNGTFDPQAFMGTLQQQGIVTQNMLDQATQLRNQAQQRNQQRQMVSLQQLLNSPDDEWAVLSSKIQRCVDLSAELNPATSPLNQRNNFQPQSAADQGRLAKALTELRTLLDDPNATDGQLTGKLTAFRDTRKLVQAELAAARKDLLALLTLRQEAILINMEIVE